jgi:hypothetical protein
VLRVCQIECSHSPTDPPNPRPEQEPWPQPAPRPTPQPQPNPNGRFDQCYRDCAAMLEKRGSNAETIKYFCNKNCDKSYASPTGSQSSSQQQPAAQCFYNPCVSSPIPNFEFERECMAPTISVDCSARNCNRGPCENPMPPPPSAPPPPPPSPEPTPETTPSGYPYGSPLGPVPVLKSPSIVTTPPEGPKACADQPEIIRNASSTFLCRNCIKFGCKISNNNRGIAARACNLTCK